MMTDTKEYFALVGSYTVHPDDTKAFREIAALSIEMTIGKDGCMYYDFSEDILQPGVIRMSEGWRDRAAFDAHAHSLDHLKTLEQAGALRILGREVYTSVARERALL